MILYTLQEVHEQTGFALASLQRDCWAGRIDHVRRGRGRFMTPEQVAKLISDHVVTAESTDVLAAVRRRIARRTAH